MKNSRTPKIVVAVGLAAVYATGLAMVTLRDEPVSNLAQSAPAETSVLSEADSVPPVEISSESTGASTGVIEQLPAMSEAPAPVASTTASKPAAALRVKHSLKTDTRSIESTIAREQGMPNVATASRAERSDVETPDPAGEVANVDNESADATGESPSSGQDGGASTGDADVLTEDSEAE